MAPRQGERPRKSSPARPSEPSPSAPSPRRATAPSRRTKRSDYLVEPTAKAVYTYDKANRLLSEGANQFCYDRAGNLTVKVTPDDEVLYQYNAAGKMVKVTKSDETYVAFAYDAFGRKVRRTEAAWVAKGNPNGTPPGLTDARGWGNNSDRPASAKTGNPVVAIDLNKVARYVDISTPEARAAVRVSGWQANAFAQASAEVLIHKGVPAETVLPYVPLQWLSE